jgi:hypothetical protein
MIWYRYHEVLKEKCLFCASAMLDVEPKSDDADWYEIT